MNITDLLQMLGQNIWIYGGSFVLVLSILVFVHEWGHYIIARACGVGVQVFSIGFGKEIFGFTDKHGTRWKFSLIPLGGYVQMIGDQDPASADQEATITEGDTTRPLTEEEKKHALFSKPVWQRAAVVFAGPAINYIFAIILLAGLYIWQGQPVTPAVGSAIMSGSSAEEAGFLPHDRILEIDGKQISDFSDIRREMMVALDEEKHFVILRNNEIIEITTRPTRIEIEDRFGFKSSMGQLGLLGPSRGLLISKIAEINGVAYETTEEVRDALVSLIGETFTITMKQPQGSDEEPSKMIVQPVFKMNQGFGKAETAEAEILILSDKEPQKFSPHSPVTAVQAAIRESYVMTRSSLDALWQIITGVRSAGELGGIIRIGAVAGDMAQQGIVPLILLTALLSINLGFINLLPIPMLDGGHLLFYAVESVIGRRVPEKIQEHAFQVGFVFLIGVMAFANLNDLYQLLN